MRILVRTKLYRAFPELDSYSDEQCERFVRAATRGGWGRCLRRAIVLLVFAAGLPVALLAMAWVGEVVEASAGPGGTGWVVLVMAIGLMIVGVGVPPTAAYIARDLLLRRRLRFVLRERGVCEGCRYSLVGLPVERSEVVCPECGGRTVVDESLGELTLNEAGRVRFTPGPLAEPTLWRRVMTPERRRRARRVVVRSVLVLGLLAAGAMLGYELFLRWQASVAAGEHLGTAGVEGAMAAASGWGPDDAGPEPWGVLQAAIAEAATISEAVRRESLPADRSQHAGWPAHEAVSFAVSRTTPWPFLPQADWDRMWLASIESARRARDAGVWARADAIAARPAARPHARFAGDQPAFIDSRWPVNELRFVQLVRVRARMSLDAGDPGDFLEALRLALGAARLLRGLASPQDAMAAAMMEWDLYQDAALAALERPDAEFLDALERVVRDAEGRPGLAAVIEGERARALDSLAWEFAEPARVRWGLRLPATPTLLPPQPERRIMASYRAQRAGLDAFFDGAAAAAGERRARGPAWLSAPPAWLGRQGRAPLYTVARYLDGAEAARRGLLVALALERFRLARGRYPESLDAIVPEFLPRIPDDPFAVAPLLYDPRPGESRYVLYSVGPFQKDNGGSGAYVPVSAAVLRESNLILTPSPKP